MINNFNFSVKLLTHSITLKLIFEFSLVLVRLVSTLRNYCINIMPSIGSLFKVWPPRGVRQPKKLPCLDFCEIKRGTGSSGTAVAVFVEWLPCLLKIYFGGPVKISFFFSLLQVTWAIMNNYSFCSFMHLKTLVVEE